MGSPERSGAVTPVTPVVPDAGGEYGPGAYLARWQDLLDCTPITPLGPTGRGAVVDGQQRMGARPDVKPVVDALGGGFRELLAERSLYW